VLETGRAASSASYRGRNVALDLVFVAAIVVFAAAIFRFVDDMHERLKRQNEELLALHSAGLDVTADLSLDVVLRKVVEQARSLVGAKYGAVSVVDKDNHIVSFITSGISPEERAAIGPPPVGHGLLGVVLREGQRLRLEDLTRHPQSRFPRITRPMTRCSPFRFRAGSVPGNLPDRKAGDRDLHHDDEELASRYGRARRQRALTNRSRSHDRAGALRIAHEMHDGLAQSSVTNTKVQAGDVPQARED
jgi:hypothetical protein